MFNTPILLLIFNRPEHTRRVVEVLRRVRPTRVYVHGDGARAGRVGEAEQVAATRAVIETIDWACEVECLYREENWGVKKGVSSGIDWYFTKVEKGIILEDDCVPDESFFPFCSELLDRYEHDERIFQIAGHNILPEAFQQYAYSYLFTPFSFIWGWATWRRAWQHMDVDLTRLETFDESGNIKKLITDLDAQAYLMDKFWAVKNGQLSSWGYAWFFSMLSQNGWSALPKINLIQNIGFGEAASNTHYTRQEAVIASSRLDFPLQHPPEVQIHDESIGRQFFYRSQKSRFLLWVNKVFPKTLVRAVGKLVGR